MRCRTGNCDEPAEAYARIEAEHSSGRRRVEKWDGNFCWEHLARVLPMKIESLNRGTRIVLSKPKEE